MLVRGGANLNDRMVDGATLLFLAAESGSLEAVKTLVLSGANPVVKTATGFTPLDVATVRGHRSIVLELLKCPGVGTFGGGELPLRLASQNGYLEVMHDLYAAGARDKMAKSPAGVINLPFRTEGLSVQAMQLTLLRNSRDTLNTCLPFRLRGLPSTIRYNRKTDTPFFPESTGDNA